MWFKKEKNDDLEECKIHNEKLRKELQNQKNMVSTLTANKEIQEAKIFDLEADLLESKPKGTIALKLIKDGVESLKWVDKDTVMADNFILSEFMQNDGLEYLKIDQDIINSLQKIREHFNKPVIITSAYRSVAYNKSIGGASKSQHIQGKAIDFNIKGVSVKNIQAYIKENWEELGITGLESSVSGWVHIDNRESDTLLEF